MLFLVTLHAHLVTADDSLEAIALAEALGHVRAELHADPALAGTAARLGLRVCPQHLHHQSGLARLALLVPVELADVVERDVVVREETAM